MTTSVPLRRRALLSVSDKTGLVDLGRRLVAQNWELVASGGTGRALAAAGLPVTPVEAVTGNPEAFGGRMKTISFEIEAAILFDRDDPCHREQAGALGLVPIDLVACNLYPFSTVAARADATLGDAIEQIDVGGPTMVRAAAKNFAHVVVMVEPADYGRVLDEMERDGSRGFPSMETRRSLAVAAFALLSAYDASIAERLDRNSANESTGERSSHVADSRRLTLRETLPLRYGENPHQQARHYRVADSEPDCLALHLFTQVQGRALSYNNLLDADAALACLCLVGDTRAAAVLIKHGNPCGAAVSADVRDAFARAWAGDPLAAFGGVVAVNRTVDASLARDLMADKRFVEMLLAPAVDDEARRLLTSRKNLRVMVNPSLEQPILSTAWEYRSIRGGILSQESDTSTPGDSDLECVTQAVPPSGLMDELLLAWRLCRASKSNAVTIVRDGMLVGNGVGQPDRVGACYLAVNKAAGRAQGAVAASDAFFPFPDGPEVLARAGVRAIIQPGGSIRDAETVALCNRYGVAMVITRGLRAFRH